METKREYCGMETKKEILWQKWKQKRKCRNLFLTNTKFPLQ
jgi:hypothetical protein